LSRQYGCGVVRHSTRHCQIDADYSRIGSIYGKNGSGIGGTCNLLDIAVFNVYLNSIQEKVATIGKELINVTENKAVLFILKVILHERSTEKRKSDMLAYYNKLSSEVYDLDKYIGRSFGDLEFYRERLASCRRSV